jgi:CRP-like cAMP-binding protein
LPRQQRHDLLEMCEPIELALEAVLCEPGERTRYVYFPTQSFVSLVSIVDRKPFLEVGMIGSEGMLGMQLALGVGTVPLRALVQGAGPAWRINARAFTKELDTNPALRRVLNVYAYVLMAQFAGAAACVRFHLIEQRLARWLLMTQDRAQADQFHVTHEFLSYMLGVRRVGVTAAAGELQSRGLIEYHRGDLHVLDRGGLEKSACSCYETDSAVYRAQLA